MIRLFTVSFCFSLFFVFSGFSQNEERVDIKEMHVYKFLEEIHGQVGTKKVLNDNPKIDKKMRNFLKNNIYLIKSSRANTVNEKLSDFKYIGKDDSVNSGNLNPELFNPFAYKLDKIKEYKEIQVDGTDYIIILNPDNK